MTNLSKATLISLIIGVFLYLTFFIWLDRSIDMWVRLHHASDQLNHTGTIISAFMNGTVIKIATAIGVIATLLIDPKLQNNTMRKIFFIFISLCAAMIISDALKFILARYRPIMLFEKNLYGLHFFSKKWAFNSTPSGHTTRAFCFFTALSINYRKLTPLFILLATAVGLSRIAVTAHYPSDVIFGAFIGIFTTLWLHRSLFTTKQTI